MKDKIDHMVKWIAITLFFIGASLLLWKITGHSPTFEAILSIFLGAVVVNQFGYERRLTRVEEKLDNLISQFKAMASDFKEHIKKV